jgi:hypothetical protein
MRIRRSVPILVVLLLLVGAIALLITLRKHAPPEPARLLPGADGFFYVNLKWIRTFNASAPLPQVSRDSPITSKFVRGYGLSISSAILIKRPVPCTIPQSWGGGTGGSRSRSQVFSEIFIGKFDSGSDSSLPAQAFHVRR